MHKWTKAPGTPALSFLTAMMSLTSALAQPANVGQLEVRPERPIYERELLSNNLAIDLAFRTSAGPQVTFERGRLDYFDAQGTSMGGLEITPAVFLSNLRIFQAVGGGTDPASVTISPGRVVLVMLPVLQFPRKESPVSLRARLFFAGFAQPLEFEEIRPRVFRENVGDYIFPFGPSPFADADWLTFQGHGLIPFSHRRSAGFAANTIFSLQRYADDYEIFQGASRTFGNPTINENYYAFGQPVVAVADGVVIRAVDGVPDNFPAGTVQNQGYGNNFHVDHENGEVSHAVHLKNGSLRVQAGQRVTQGEVLAELGNSGSSSAPHVHFEMALSIEADPGALTPLHTEAQPFYPKNIRMLGARQIGTILPTNIPFEVVDPPVIADSPQPEGPGTIAENEPNGDLASAQALTLPVTVQGTIRVGEAGDWADAGDVIEDIFRLDLSEPATLWLRVESQASADLDLLLFDDRQRFVAESASSAASEELVVDLEPGIYFMFLSEFGHSAEVGPESDYVLQAAFLDQELFFAQYGQGEGLTSTLLLINPSTDGAAAAAVLDLRRGSGERFPDSPQAANADGTLAVLRVPSQGLARLPSPSQGELVTGSATVLANRELSGTILFGGPQGLAGVPSISLLSDFVLPVEMDVSRGVRTGIAVANPADSAMEISLTMLDDQGVVISESSHREILPARGRSAHFADEIFADSGVDFEHFAGVLRVSATQPVAAMVIRSSPGEFATFPVTGVETPVLESAASNSGTDPTVGQIHIPGRRHQTARQEGRLAGRQEGQPHIRFFPQFAAGPGISSTLVVVNPSPDRSRTAQIELTGQEGNPLTALLTGQEILEAQIAPLGVRFLSLPASAQLVNGWARLEADGPVGAVIVLEGDFGVAGIASSGMSAEFLSPVDLDLESAIQTGIALVNPSDSVTAQVTLQLRGPDGQPIAVTELSLGPEGQRSRQVQELFPSFNLTEFIGVLDVVSDIPLAATAIRQSPAQFATLPVAPTTP